MTRTAIFTSFVYVLGLTAAADAADYYVSQKDAMASDRNAGTEARPFKTIRAALEALAPKIKPGDTVWIKEGVYRTQIRLRAKGVSAAGLPFPSGEGYTRPITFAGFPGHKVVLSGSDVVTGWKPYKGDVWVRDGWPVRSQQVFLDGRPLEQIGGRMAGGIGAFWHWKHKGKSLDDLVPGSFHHDDKSARLYVRLAHGASPKAHLVEASVRNYAIGVSLGMKFVHFANFTVTQTNNRGTEPAVGVNGSHCVFERLDQSWGAFGGAYVGGEYNTFLNCRFNHNGNNGMGASGRGHRVIHCETAYNNYRNWSMGWHAGGVKFIPYCHDFVLAGHVSCYNNGDGIWFDGAMSNVTIEGCRSFRNKGAGIHYEIGSRGVIKNNICYENGFRGIYLSNSSYTLVANNVCVRNGMSGIVSIGVKRPGAPAFNRGSGVIPGGHNVVTGNILMDNCDAKALLELHTSWPLPADYAALFAATYEKFKGWHNRPELIMPDATNEPAHQGGYSDYNIFYRTRVSKKALARLPFGLNWNVGYAYGLPDWREKTGFDTHSIVAKPRFVNLAEYDFHPAEDCPSQWFLKQYDQSIRYDFDGVRRPYTPAAHTAGPFVGDVKRLEKLIARPQTERHAMYVFSRRPWWRDGRQTLTAMIKSMKSREVAALRHGVVVDDVPFVVPDGGLYYSEHFSGKASLKLEQTVKKVHFLFAARASAEPFVRCTIHRDDGVKTVFVWKADAKGGFETLPACHLQTREVWSGLSPFARTKDKNRRVFMTTWENDNPWLPVKRIEFEHIDKSARMGLYGVTGERCR